MDVNLRLREEKINNLASVDTSLRSHIKAGGKAKLLVMPKSVEELKKTLQILKECNERYAFIGRMSNSIVRSRGWRMQD